MGEPHAAQRSGSSFGGCRFSQQALIFGAGDDEPTLVLRDVDRGVAGDSSWLEDVRCYHFGADDPSVNGGAKRDRCGGVRRDHWASVRLSP